MSSAQPITQDRPAHSQFSQEARLRLAEHVVSVKARKGLSWKQLAEGTGLAVEFVTTALLGQHCLPPEAAARVGERLDLGEDDIRLLQSIPLRGSPASVPSDPTIYRFYEIVQVYGPTLKALIHEEFGDGIMSAINFRLKLDKVPDPEGGERVVITLDGKYLPARPF